MQLFPDRPVHLLPAQPVDKPPPAETQRPLLFGAQRSGPLMLQEIRFLGEARVAAAGAGVAGGWGGGAQEEGFLEDFGGVDLGRRGGGVGAEEERVGGVGRGRWLLRCVRGKRGTWVGGCIFHGKVDGSPELLWWGRFAEVGDGGAEGTSLVADGELDLAGQK